MKDYLQLVWELAMHPQNGLDLLPAIQLVLAFICWYYVIRVFILIYQDKKQKDGTK
jgi:hypothetical protein